MKKTGIVIIFTLMSLMAYSQSNFYIGLNTGPFFKLNSNILHPIGYGGPGLQLNPKDDLAYGLYAGYYFSSNSRVRIEAKYIKMQYEKVYSWETIPPSSQMFFFKYDLDINSLALNIIYDYKLFASNRFSIFISPGFKTQFVLSETEQCIDPDDFVELQHGKSLYGLGIGVTGKYIISKRVGVVLIPDGSYYFNKFFDDEEKNFKSLSINLGLEIKP